MAAATVESIERKKERAEEANKLIEGLDEVTQKAVYIATKMFLAQRDTEEGKGGRSDVKENRQQKKRKSAELS